MKRNKLNKIIKKIIAFFILFSAGLFLCKAEIPDEVLDFYWCVSVKRKLEDEKAVTLTSGEVILQTGDKVSFYIEPLNSTSFVYMLIFDATEDCLLLYPRDIRAKQEKKVFSCTLDVISRGMMKEVCLLASPVRLKKLEKTISQIRTTPEGKTRDQLLYELRLFTNLFIKNQFSTRTSTESLVPFGGVYRQRVDFKKIRVKGSTPYGRKILFTY
jgi:hypothetical protein